VKKNSVSEEAGSSETSQSRKKVISKDKIFALNVVEKKKELVE
jgi:hypothetical protein